MSQGTEVNEHQLRNIAAHWFFKQLWNNPTLPDQSLYLEYTRALMNLAGADGVLADSEREWILGNLLIKGGTIEDYQALKTYQPNRSDLEKMISGKPVTTKVLARSMLFESFQAASADGELHAKERAAIYQLGRSMGVEDEMLHAIEKAAADDKTNRHRICLLYTSPSPRD